MKDKIGIGIVTTGREGMFVNCSEHLTQVDYTVAIHNGTPYESYLPNHIELKTYPEVMNVAINKNRALRAMIQNGCTHLFLIEDDISINAADVCERYIEAASESGIWHLNYGSGDAINTMEYTDTVSIDLLPDLSSSFTYYHRNIIKHVGYFDERFRSGLSGPEHTYRVAKKRLCPSYGVFANCKSENTIVEQDYDKDHSIITYQSESGISTIQNDTYLFVMKHGETLIDIVPPDQKQLEEELEMLKENYSRPV